MKINGKMAREGVFSKMLEFWTTLAKWVSTQLPQIWHMPHLAQKFPTLCQFTAGSGQ